MWKCRWPASRICLHLEMLHNLSLQFPVMWLFPNKFSAVMVVIMLMKTGKKKKKWTKQGRREGRWRKKRKKNDSFPKPKLNKNRHSYLPLSHCLKIHIYRNTCEKRDAWFSFFKNCNMTAGDTDFSLCHNYAKVYPQA